MLTRCQQLLLFSAVVSPATVMAQPELLDGFGGTVDYGTSCLSPNDDGSSAGIDLTAAFPGGLEFFGRRHTIGYVNSNGNITFSGPLPQFTPTAFPVADRPMIAPFWADVDIRNTGGSCMGAPGRTCVVCAPCHNPTENGIWWHLEPGLMVVTWDRVGYFNCHNDHRMTFQLILREARFCGVPGDFDVEFRYTQCDWETGDASGGSGGFGGTQAQVGFDAGNLTDFVSIPGSRMAGISMNMCMSSNVGEDGVWRFRIRRGAVLCPDAGDTCDTGMQGVCGDGLTTCVGAAVECQPLLAPGDERCDLLDNDCDGSVDESDSPTDDLCPGLPICDRGTCIEPCFEGGCDIMAGQICVDPGVCVDEACEEVTCPPGQRCQMGTCTDICDGVVCPAGQDCLGGRCVDLCATVDCPPCRACLHGACVQSCVLDGCGDGEACEEDGLCVEAACLGVRCGPGRTCVGGTCADSCADAVCPEGEECSRGECSPAGPPMPDGGLPDGGSGTDAGDDGDAGPGGMDGGGRTDGGDGTGDDPGCGCRTPGGPSGGGAGGALVLLVLGLLAIRRRRP